MHYLIRMVDDNDRGTPLSGPCENEFLEGRRAKQLEHRLWKLPVSNPGSAAR